MRETRVVTDRADFRSVAADAAGGRVPVALRAVVDDPYDAYRRARDGDGRGGGDGDDRGDGAGDGRGDGNGDGRGDGDDDGRGDGNGDCRGVFLETTGGQSGWGYFAVDPVDFLTVAPDAVVADPAVEPAHTAGVSPTLEALDGLLAGESLARGDCEVPYPCGAFGWLSYDVARELEAIPASNPPDRDLPRLQVGVYDRVVAWEEPRGDGETAVTVTACPRVPADAVSDTDALDDLYDAALERARDLVERAATGDPGVGPAPAPATGATFESNCGRAAFADRVRAVKRYVRDGDTFQANISQRLEAPAAVHPVEAYDALRTVNPAPYSALLEFPGVDLVSASPELLLERRGNRLLTEPIAGTRPRGDSAGEDEALEADLVGDEKERAEHAMLVDLERNDLGKVSTYGTVTVPEYRRVDRYSEVMHLVSLVEGELRDGATLSDAVAAVFPGGTITGAPKPRTMEIIEELESRRRGPYTGSIGVFGFDGRATLNIVIRTLVRHGDEYHLSVGAGIVHDSEPEREYEETLDKARALVRAVTAALERGRLTVEGGDS